ncbi:hypothetical protein CAEBREN_07757 [Caenorhabditis brenneri]|uniref:Uncharacterized protein n=1 Tax=Caenorhabditis brenneri TaxID=135651 RepID=G0N519_CAEBE|nr:hypothetical protein CAEBREN_07757 [Caenorhabditis brenneri]
MEGPEVSEKIPSLLLLSSLSVGEYLLQGEYDHVDFGLAEKGSNIVLEVVTNARIKEKPEIDRLHEVLMKMVNPSKVDVSKGLYKKDRDLAIQFIQKQFLKELKLGNLTKFEKYFTNNVAGPPQKKPKLVGGTVQIDIVALLNDCLRTESKRMLEKLDFTECSSTIVTFAAGWVQSMAQQFRSLKDLNLDGIKLTSAEFTILCESFPQLTTLNITRTGLTSLNGISQLVFLSDLTVGGDYVAKLLIEVDKSIPSLEELVFDGAALKDYDLMTITDKNDNLQTIVLLGCTGHFYEEIAPVQLIAETSIWTCIDGIYYFLERKSIDFEKLGEFMESALWLVRNEEKEWTSPDNLLYLNETLHQLIPVIGYRKEMLEVYSVFKKITKAFKRKIYKNGDKLMLIDSSLRLAKWTRVMKAPSENDWDYMYDLVKMTQNPPADEIVAETMKTLMMNSEKEVLYYLKIIDFFADKIDSSSKLYAKVDKNEIVQCMKKIHQRHQVKEEQESDDEYNERKMITEKVLKFFEFDFK